MDALINRLSQSHVNAKHAANQFSQALKDFDSEKTFVNEMLQIQNQKTD